MSEGKQTDWRVVRCDDGYPMVCTEGDVICVPDRNHSAGDEGDEKNFRMIAAVRELLEALQNIKRFGELACVSTEQGHFTPSGKKPGSKEVWQFPRHMLTEIDAAISKATTP